MRTRKKAIQVSLIFLTVIIAGCSHQLKITNPNDYVARAPYIEDKIVIGILSASSQQEETFVEYIIDELRGIGNIKVKYPYAHDEKRPVNYVLDLRIMVKYGGSWSNFFISWPGYIIFTPAWHGYNYNADISTDISVTDFGTGDIVTTQNYRNMYKCVQAEFDRTWIELGWLEYGILPFIGGFFFTKYDDDITNDFNREIARPYGNYIARKIGALVQSLK